MFKFYIKKCYCVVHVLVKRSKTFKSKKITYLFASFCEFRLSVPVSNQGPHDPYLSMLTNRLQRHLWYLLEIWNLYQTTHFSRNFKNPKKFWISEKNWNSRFQNFEKINLIILPNRSNRSNRKKSLIRLDRFIGQRINTCGLICAYFDRPHCPSRSTCTLFCLGVSSSQGIYSHIPNFRKVFNVRMKVIFGEKSLSSMFRLLRQELTTVFPDMWYCFTTAKGAENWSRAIHVRLRGFERCTVIFGESLLVSFGHCRPLVASQVTGRKDMKVPHKFTQP